jgi:hypothetical protein
MLVVFVLVAALAHASPGFGVGAAVLGVSGAAVGLAARAGAGAAVVKRVGGWLGKSPLLAAGWVTVLVLGGLGGGIGGFSTRRAQAATCEDAYKFFLSVTGKSDLPADQTRAKAEDGRRACDAAGMTRQEGALAAVLAEIDRQISAAQEAANQAAATQKVMTDKAARAARLPPEPPPDPVAVKLNDLPKWPAKLAADKAYAGIWEPGRRSELKAMLTGLSSLLAISGMTLPTFEALQSGKVHDAATALWMIELRTRRLPDDFVAAFRKFLEVAKGEPHLGVWSPEERGRAPHDFSALAAWVNRDEPAYIRELLAARTTLGWSAWDAQKNGPPARPYLTYEVDALKWLALLDKLTPDERARLTALNDEAATLKVSAATLWQAYHSNEVAADEVYKGKKLLITGTVAEVKKDAFDNIVVWLETPNMFMRVMAKVKDSEKPRAAQLGKGGAVTALCEGGTMIMGSPTLHDCVLR